MSGTRVAMVGMSVALNYVRRPALKMAQAMRNRSASASTRLVLTDPEATLPATVSTTTPGGESGGKSSGMGRSVNIVDSEGNPASSAKR